MWKVTVCIVRLLLKSKLIVRILVKRNTEISMKTEIKLSFFFEHSTWNLVHVFDAMRKKVYTVRRVQTFHAIWPCIKFHKINILTFVVCDFEAFPSINPSRFYVGYKSIAFFSVWNPIIWTKRLHHTATTKNASYSNKKYIRVTKMNK